MLFTKADLKRLLIPLLLEQLLAVTIGMADTMMVSGVGEAAVSGVSLVDSVNVVLINLFSALATGGAVLVSQYIGRKEPENAGLAAKQLIYVATLVSLTIAVLCLALRQPLLVGLFGHIEPAVMQNAQVYFILSALSYPFLALYNGGAALLRAMGNSKASFHTSIVMNLINVCGNALFIFGFGWGAMGAGMATLLSRIAGSLCILAMLKNPHNPVQVPSLLKWSWRPDMVRGILAVGIPNGVEGSFFNLGRLLLLRLISTFGTASIAANAIANSYCTMQCVPGNACCLAMITVVGRCMGAREYQQARHYTKSLTLFSTLAFTACSIPLVLLAPVILPLCNLSPEASDIAYKLIVLHGVGGSLLWSASFTLPNALRAANDGRFTMTVSIISMIVFRIGSSYLLASTTNLGALSVWIAMEIDWVFRIIMFIWRFLSGKWETKALIQ